MGTFSALLAICVGNSPVTGEFSTQRTVTRSFDVFFDLRLNKHSWGWWFEMLSCPLWCHHNEYKIVQKATGKLEEKKNLSIYSNILAWGIAKVTYVSGRLEINGHYY